MNNVSTYDSVYQVKLAQIAALQGDITKKYDSVYQTELEILKKLEEGIGGGALIDDQNISTGTVWSSYKTDAEIKASMTGDYEMFTVGQEWTQADADKRRRLYTTYGDKMFNHIYIKSDLTNGYNRCTYYEGGAMCYAEYYGGKLVYTILNDNIHAGGHLDISFRKYYSDDITVDTSINNNFYNKTYIDGSLNTIKAGLNASINVLNGQLSDISTRMSDKVDVSDFLLDEQILANGLYNLNQKSSSAAQIDDTLTSISTVWSSNKTNVEVLNVSAYMIAHKQDNLVSGTNIKTIDNQLILGSGNLIIGSNKELKTDADTASAVIAESEYNINKYKVLSAQVKTIYSLTQAEYDAITTKDASTLYIINDASI